MPLLCENHEEEYVSRCMQNRRVYFIACLSLDLSSEKKIFTASDLQKASLAT